MHTQHSLGKRLLEIVALLPGDRRRQLARLTDYELYKFLLGDCPEPSHAEIDVPFGGHDCHLRAVGFLNEGEWNIPLLVALTRVEQHGFSVVADQDAFARALGQKRSALPEEFQHVTLATRYGATGLVTLLVFVESKFVAGWGIKSTNAWQVGMQVHPVNFVVGRECLILCHSR